jgi:hypothetical protein
MEEQHKQNVDGMKEKFIELLDEEAAQAHKFAEAWRILAESGGQLEDLHGRVIATTDEKVTEFLGRESECRAMISSIKALPS